MRQRLGRKEGEGLELGLDGLRRLAADGDREAARLLAAEAIRRDSLELLIEAEQSMLEPAQDWPGFSEWGVSPQGFRELWHVRTGMMFLELPGPEPSTPVLHEAQPSQQSGSEASANAALREGAELRRLGRVRLTKQNRWLKADFLPQRSLVARERVPERVLDRFLTETKWLPVEDLWSQEDGGVDDYVGSELMGYKLPAFLLWSGLQLPHLWQLEQVYAGSGASDRLGRRAVAEYRTRKRHAMHYGDWRLLSLSALAWDTQEECGLRALNTLAQEVGSVDAQSFVHTAYGTVEYHVEDFRQNPVRELAPARLRLACFADGQEQLGPVNGESAQSDWRALRALLAPPRAPSRPQLCEQVALRLRYEYEQLQQSWARREQERQAEEARSLAAAALEVRRNAFRRQRVRSQE
ncbi:MAG: hypothetical protein RBU37_25085, partial [Myxococcota bacterium]|nr:hypothetical protein [Myxococcota bacterium]